MKMELSSGAALKITTLTLAIAAASLSTTAVMAAECQLNDANTTTISGATSNVKTALACGNAAKSSGTNDTVAIGNMANAGMNSATAVGGQANAAGLGSTSIGWQSAATAERAQAFGHLAKATGVRSTAVGEAAVAQGAGSVALGNQSAAGGSNSIAIGNGANASNDNQVVLGNTGQLQASTGSQTGGTNIVTTDANGTLGTSVSVDSLATSRQFNDLRSRYDRQEDRLDEAEDGIAMALSMETPVIPSGKRYAMGFGTGYYNNSTAVSASFAGRASDSVTISAGAGYGTDSGKVGARGGVTFAW